LGQFHSISKVHVDHRKDKQHDGKENAGADFCRQGRGKYLGKPGFDKKEPVSVEIEHGRDKGEKHRPDDNDENEPVSIEHHEPLFF
jgi:hypothetical protein